MRARADAIKKNTNAKSTDFTVDEETGGSNIEDGRTVTVGGMVSDCNIKYTKNNHVMAFVTLEDLYGVIEVVVFQRDYEKYRELLTRESRVYITGHADIGDRGGKLILSRAVSMDRKEQTVWIRFSSKEEYDAKSRTLSDIIEANRGDSEVVVYLSDERAKKSYGASKGISASEAVIAVLKENFGGENVKVVESLVF